MGRTCRDGKRQPLCCGSSPNKATEEDRSAQKGAESLLGAASGSQLPNKTRKLMLEFCHVLKGGLAKMALQIKQSRPNPSPF